MFRAFVVLFFALAFGSTAEAQQRTTAILRVVDVGNGLCVIAWAPPNHTMVYDAGYSGTRCADTARALSGGDIRLMVLSHSDDDHIDDAPRILEQNRVRLVIHPGDDHPNTALPALRELISTNADREINLASGEGVPAFGRTFPVGRARARFIAGWGDGHETETEDETPLRDAPLRNAVSIVIRFEYAGRSVLLTGDTIGRLNRDSDDLACRYAEARMVENAERRPTVVPIDSDVLVGQHHGGDNSSSDCFIRAVSPRFVIFSAGRSHGHPAESTVWRMHEAGVDVQNIFRTDRGDDEGEGEWDGERIDGCTDRAGDDDIEIRITASGRLTVRYMDPVNVCSAES